MSKSKDQKQDRFSEEDRKLLESEGFRTEKHPYDLEFAINKRRYSIITMNDDGTFSARHDDGNSDSDEETHVCSTVKEAIEFLSLVKH